MDAYIDVLKEYLERHKPKYGRCDAGSLIGILFCCYQQGRRQDDFKVKECYRALDRAVSDFSLKQQDQVTDAVSDLCQEYGMCTFRDGVVVGFHLYEELHKRSVLSAISDRDD